MEPSGDGPSGADDPGMPPLLYDVALDNLSHEGMVVGTAASPERQERRMREFRTARGRWEEAEANLERTVREVEPWVEAASESPRRQAAEKLLTEARGILATPLADREAYYARHAEDAVPGTVGQRAPSLIDGIRTGTESEHAAERSARIYAKATEFVNDDRARVSELAQNLMRAAFAARGFGFGAAHSASAAVRKGQSSPQRPSSITRGKGPGERPTSTRGIR